MESNPRVWIAALRGSHDHLERLVRPLPAARLRGMSYCSDWTIAQVLSHLGSGAEISVLRLKAALSDGVLPPQEVYQQIWDTWNAKSPDAMAADALVADSAHIDALERASDEELAGISLSMFGMELDAVGLIRLRLSEHALHTWDVEVSIDKAAVVGPEPVSLLIDSVPMFAGMGRVPSRAEPLDVRIITTAPPRDYVLTAAEAVQMSDWPGAGGDGAGPSETVRMPAEALLRLTSGRLDPEHTPSGVSADPATLGALRELFPGL
jgi:uncharacterized protein (TIGR03083 family)